jgi:hypothetical protein
MSATSKGIISIILGLFAVFSIGIFSTLHIRLGVPLTTGISFLLAVLATYLGAQARKNNAKIVGMAGLTLGIIGIIVIGFSILALVSR